MTTSNSNYQNGCEWRELYKAALSDLDTDRLPERIADAEKALVSRSRELFQAAGDNIEEQQALDDAMYVERLKIA
jgi:hypothetical protein